MSSAWVLVVEFCISMRASAVLGCPDLPPSEGVSYTMQQVRGRSADKDGVINLRQQLIVRCNHSNDVYRLTCRKNVWIGPASWNCANNKTGLCVPMAISTDTHRDRADTTWGEMKKGGLWLVNGKGDGRWRCMRGSEILKESCFGAPRFLHLCLTSSDSVRCYRPIIDSVVLVNKYILEHIDSLRWFNSIT